MAALIHRISLSTTLVRILRTRSFTTRLPPTASLRLQHRSHAWQRTPLQRTPMQRTAPCNETCVATYSTEVETEGQKEHEYAHSLLEKIVSYQTRLLTPNEYETTHENFDAVLERLNENSSFEEMLGIAHELSLMDRSAKILAVSDAKFRNLTDKLMDLLSSASNEELKDIVDAYSRLNCKGAASEFKRQVSKLALALKSELLGRDDLSVDALLYFMDFFNHVARQALSSSFMGKFATEMDSLNKEQTILLLHNLSVSYSSHKRHDLLVTLEEKIEGFFDDCKTQELAVASLGFFRSRYVLASESLVERLTARLLQDVNDLTEMTVISLIKIINYSTRNGTAYTNQNVRQNMRNITQTLLPRINEFSPSSCTNLFRTSASLHQLNHNLMDALCQKVVHSDIDVWRLKDIAWFTFTFGQFQCMMEEPWFYDKIVKTLEKDHRRPEISKHPNMLVQALVGLSLAGVYPNNLLNEVMSPLFRSNMKSRIPLDLSRDLFFLDQGLRLERPNYDGFLLPDDFFDSLPGTHPVFSERRLPHDKARQSKRDEMLLQIQSSLDLLCGRDMCAEIAFVFRHHNTADIVLKVDENKRPVPVYEWKTVDLAIRDPSRQKTILVLIAAPNSYTMYDTEYGYARKLLATHLTKRRQAELLGHKVVEIPYFKWYDRGANRRQYLIDLLGHLVNLER